MKKIAYYIIAIWAILMPTTIMAQSEPYAVLSDDNTKLTFYYDDQKATRNGMGVGPFDGTWDNSLQTYIVNSDWFDQRENIATVEFDTSFAGCNTITSTAWWFHDFKNLTTITNISNLKTNNVTNMGWMFSHCSSLTSLDVSSFKTDNVTGMQQMFEWCTSLPSIDLSGFNTSKVTNMYGMFSCSSKIETIYVGSEWSTDNVTWSNYMFYNCTNLVGGMGTMFDSNHTDHAYAHIDEGPSNPGYFTRFGTIVKRPYAVLSDDNTKLTFYYDDQKAARNGMSVGPFIWNGDEPNTIWYDQREQITSVEFDASFAGCNTITSTAWWFHDFKNLTTITNISNLKTDNVTDMGFMFYGCSSLTSLDVSGFNTENVTNMYCMFGGCSSLSNLDLSNFKTDNVTNMSGMFFNCSKIETIYVGSEWSTAKVTESYRMFTGCAILVGGMGTMLDSNHTDHAYAHIDEGPSNPGYFTRFGTIVKRPYAVLSDNNTKLTFYFDDQKAARNGMIVGSFTRTWDNSLQRYIFNYDWYDQRKIIKNVVFDDSFANCNTITSTAYWFYECSNLTTINGISNLKTDNVTNMLYMFAGCSGLTSLDLSGFNTAKVTDMSSMFEGCSGLTNINLSGFNTENVTYMNYMFAYCSGLTSLDLSGFNTEKVTDMGDMFGSCWSLTNLDLSNFKTDNVTNMSGMFYGCRGLTSLDVSNFMTDNVTDMGGMFMWSPGLTSLDLSNFKTDNVTDMNCMFDGCSGLENLDVSNFKTDNVTNMGRMFYGCSKLETIYASSEWSTEKVTEGNDMFTGCTNLVGGMGTQYDSNHTDCTYAHIDEGPSNPGYFTRFGTIVKRPYAVLSDNNTKLTFYYDDQKAARNGMIVGSFTRTWDNSLQTYIVNSDWYDQRKIIKNVVFDDSFANCNTITSTAYWFYECSNLTTINGISNLKTDNVTNMLYMFAGCSGLKALDVSGFRTDNVTDMGFMFYGCSSLTSLDVSGFNTENVTYMNYMFAYCSGLTSLDLSNFKTNNVTNMRGMFRNCSNLKSLDLSGFNTEKVTDMGDMFGSCWSLTNLDLSNFKTDNVTDMNCMFDGCSGLENLDVSNFKTDNVTNMGDMFRACSSLTSLDLSSFKTNNATNMGRMFNGCSKLETIYASSEWSTEKVTEGNDMFTGCAILVGGMGTQYDSNHTDCAYAHIDEGASNPGYFTLPGTFRLSITATGNGVVTFDNNSFRNQTVTFAVEANASATITLTPDEGYKVKSLFVNGNDVTSNITDNHYTISNISTNNTIEVEFKIIAEPYAALSDNNTKLTFYYDDKKDERNGMSVRSFTGTWDYSLQTYIVNSDWFDQREKITTVVFDKSFANCAITSTAWWFYGLKNLTTITDFSNLKTDNVTDMSWMFDNCTSLTDLDVSGFNTANVEHMEHMFDGCTSLTDLDVSGFNTANVMNMGYMFMGCSSLKSLDVSGFNTSKVINMMCMFQGCSSLNSLNVSNFRTDNVTNMHSMFDSCSGVSTLDLSGFKTSNVTDMSWMFNGCSKMETILASNEWSTEKVTESDNMFSGCTNLVGGMGTKYDASHTDYTFARIDGGTSNPGYFTRPGTFRLYISSTGNGSVTYDNYAIRNETSTFTVEADASATIHINPDDNYRVKSLIVNNKYVTSNITDNQYTITNVNANTTIEVEFERTYILTIKATGSGTVSYGDTSVRGETSTFTIGIGESAILIITPDEGYEIDSAKLNDEDILSGIVDKKFTIADIQDDYIVDVVFDEIITAITTEEVEFNVVSKKDRTVVVAAGDYGLLLDVPATFNAKDREWTVTGIEAGALQSATELAAIIWNPEVKFTESVNNPNLLLYVKSKDYAPSGINNVIVDNKADNIILTDAAEGNNFYCPQAFTAAKVTYVHNYSMKTGFNTCQGWETIVLPFDVSMVYNDLGTDLVPYSLWKLGDNQRPFWLYSLDDKGWSSESAIKANTPYIISMPNNDNYDTTYNLSGDIVFSALNVKVQASDNLASRKYGNRELVPNYKNKESSTDIFALNVNNLWDKYTDNNPLEGSTFIRNLRQIRPFEAYMTIGNNSTTRSIAIFGDGNTTSIESLPMINNGKSGNIRVYTLSGVLVKQGTDESVIKDLPKGIYIINNRKVVVD